MLTIGDFNRFWVFLGHPVQKNIFTVGKTGILAFECHYYCEQKFEQTGR